MSLTMPPKNKEKKQINWSSIFERNVPGATDVLQKKTVGIAGLGGLGSNAAVALARSGVGHLVLADFDVVELSNLNRQSYFLEDVGTKKTEALPQYLKSINPNLQITIFTGLLSRDNVPAVFERVDLLIEAFDKAEDKSWLIEVWTEQFPDRPIVCASGLGGYGKTDNLKVRISGNIYICGDGQSDVSMGLCAPRVGIVASMQANVAVEILVDREKTD